jgi:phosphoribosylformimino-5-aminoimidazole carboxamide ribotide isomerase
VFSESAAYYAQLYRQHELMGGHVIQLGTGNEEAAIQALQAWPGSFICGNATALFQIIMLF